METEPLTVDMIRALRNEAAAAGDTATVETCETALYGKSWDGAPEARRKVAAMITDARAADDSKPLVRVEAEPCS